MRAMVTWVPAYEAWVFQFDDGVNIVTYAMGSKGRWTYMYTHISPIQLASPSHP